MEADMQCNLKIGSMKTCIIVEGMGGCDRVQKHAHLERWLTNTVMIDLLYAFRSPIMKSMEISVQILANIGSGCTTPTILIISPIFL